MNRYNYTLGDMQLDTEAEMVCHADPPLTTTKAPKTECCDSVTLRSDGAMADSIQKHVLGTYKVPKSIRRSEICQYTDPQ